MALSRVFLIVLLVVMVLSEGIELPPAMLYGTGQQICNYQYAIPSGGNCVTYGPSLEHHLTVVQQDMDRIKLQYVSQNTVLQEELRKLRQQASTTDANMADLTKDLKSLEATVFSLQAKVSQPVPTTTNNNNNNNGPSNALLQQLVTTTRAQLTQELIQLQNQMNSAIGSLRTDRQRDAVQQSKVDGAFQAQLRQQQQDLTTILQSLQQLQNRVNTLQLATAHPPTSNPYKPPTTAPTITPFPVQTLPPVTAGTGPTTPNPLLLQLQTDLQQLGARVKQVEKDMQTDLPDLKKGVATLKAQVKNQSLDLSDAKTEADFLLNTKVPQMEGDIQKNYGAISQVSQTIQQNLGPLQQQVNKVAQNVTNLNTQVTRLGSDFFAQKVQLRTDESSITDLQTQIHIQASRLTNLIQNQHFTNPTTRAPTTTTFAIPTPKHG